MPTHPVPLLGIRYEATVAIGILPPRHNFSGNYWRIDSFYPESIIDFMPRESFTSTLSRDILDSMRFMRGKKKKKAHGGAEGLRGKEL